MKRRVYFTIHASLLLLIAMGQQVGYSDLDLVTTGKHTLGYKEMHADVGLELDASDAEELIIHTGAGSKKLLASDNHLVKVEATIVFTARNLEKAEKLITRSLRLGLVETDLGIELTSIFDFEDKEKEFSTGGLFNAPNRRVDLTVYVPAGLALDIQDRSGDLSIKGLKNDVRVVDGSGSLIIEQHEGALDVLDRSGIVILREINWSSGMFHEVELKDYSGAIEVERGSGHIRITDYSGAIITKESKGSLTVSDQSGGIFISQHAGSSELKDASGSIHVTQHDGLITIEDTSGAINLEDITEVILKRDSSGKVNTKSVGKFGS